MIQVRFRLSLHIHTIGNLVVNNLNWYNPLEWFLLQIINFHKQIVAIKILCLSIHECFSVHCLDFKHILRNAPFPFKQSDFYKFIVAFVIFLSIRRLKSLLRPWLFIFYKIKYLFYIFVRVSLQLTNYIKLRISFQIVQFFFGNKISRIQLINNWSIFILNFFHDYSSSNKTVKSISRFKHFISASGFILWNLFIITSQYLGSSSSMKHFLFNCSQAISVEPLQPNISRIFFLSGLSFKAIQINSSGFIVGWTVFFCLLHSRMSHLKVFSPPNFQ